MFGLGWNLIVCVCFFTLFCEQTSSECRQLTPCSCIFPDGQGYDLSPLHKLSPLQTPTNDYTFFFHPCTNALMNCSKGSDVSLCLQHGNTTVNLGKVEETTIEAGSEKVQPSLIVHHNNYSSSIGLLCNDFSTSHLIIDKIDGNSQFHLLLISPYACKVVIRHKGLSIGSIILIYFFILNGIYFIGGAITLKLLRGATGWEMVPNHKFWRELPSLVKDGITFTFNCCHVDSYQSI